MIAIAYGVLIHPVTKGQRGSPNEFGPLGIVFPYLDPIIVYS